MAENSTKNGRFPPRKAGAPRNPSRTARQRRGRTIPAPRGLCNPAGAWAGRPRGARLAVGEEPADLLQVGSLDGPRAAEAALPLGGLLGEDVAVSGLAALHLAAARELEALGRAPVGLHFRHLGFLPPPSSRGRRPPSRSPRPGGSSPPLRPSEPLPWPAPAWPASPPAWAR